MATAPPMRRRYCGELDFSFLIADGTGVGRGWFAKDETDEDVDDRLLGDATARLSSPAATRFPPTP